MREHSAPSMVGGDTPKRSSDKRTECSFHAWCVVLLKRTSDKNIFSGLLCQVTLIEYPGFFSQLGLWAVSCWPGHQWPYLYSWPSVSSTCEFPGHLLVHHFAEKLAVSSASWSDLPRPD